MVTLIKFLKSVGVLSAITLLLFSSYGSYRYFSSDDRSNTRYHVYEEMTILKYDKTKYDLVVAVDEYIKNTAPSSCLNGIIVVEECLNRSMDICFVLAQGNVESHFGTTGLARKTNSVWNVFAYDGYDYDSISPLGKYNSPDESIVPYLDLLNNRYLVNGKTEYDLMDKFVDKNGKRYASATNYENAIRTKYNIIKNTTPIDSLSLELKKYTIILGY